MDIFKKNKLSKRILTFYQKYQVIILCLILLLIILSTFLRGLILPLILFIMVLVVQKLNCDVPSLSYLGIEFGYFSTIVVGYIYGSKAGLYFGILFLIAHIIHSAYWDINPLDVLMKIILIPLIGYVSYFIKGHSLIFFGTMLVAIISFFIFIIDQITIRHTTHKMIVWCLGLIVFNYCLFKVFLPLILLFT